MSERAHDHIAPEPSDSADEAPRPEAAPWFPYGEPVEAGVAAPTRPAPAVRRVARGPASGVLGVLETLRRMFAGR